MASGASSFHAAQPRRPSPANPASKPRPPKHASPSKLCPRIIIIIILIIIIIIIGLRCVRRCCVLGSRPLVGCIYDDAPTTCRIAILSQHLQSTCVSLGPGAHNVPRPRVSSTYLYPCLSGHCDASSHFPLRTFECHPQ